MKRYATIHRCIAAATIGAVILARPVMGGLPLPDAVFYGEIRIDGQLMTNLDDVSLVARVGLNVVGEFVSGAGLVNDCNNNGIPDGCDLQCTSRVYGCGGVDCGQSNDFNNDGVPDDCFRYVLKIKMESTADGSPNAPDHARVGNTVNLYVVDGRAGKFCNGNPDGQTCTTNADCGGGPVTCKKPETLVATRVLNKPGYIEELYIGGSSLIIIAGNPPNNAIDARQPSQPNGANPAGWNSVAITFDGPAAGLTPADFTVTVTSGVAPAVTSVVTAGDVATLQLSTFIPVGAWTTITHNASGTSTRLGYLPADVNGDKIAAAGDVLNLINHLNGVVTYPIWSTDIDRSGLTGTPDVLRVIDLLNGAGIYPVFNFTTLP